MLRLAPLAVFLCVSSLAGCDPVGGPPALDPPRPPPPGGAVRIAGAELAHALTERLVGIFTAREPGQAIVVDEPLGSTGALQAVAANLLDAALVVQVEGEPPPARGLAFARTRPVLVVGPGVRVRRMHPDELTRTLLGVEPVWPDGLARRVLLRGPDDPLQRALVADQPGLVAAFDEATAAHRWRWFSSESNLRDALRRTPGALTVMDTGGLSLAGTPVWRVGLTATTSRWLTFWLVPGPRPSVRLQALMRSLSSADGQALIREFGYRLP